MWQRLNSFVLFKYRNDIKSINIHSHFINLHFYFRRFNKFNKVGAVKGRAQFQPEEQSLLPTPGPTSQLYMGFTIGKLARILQGLWTSFQLKQLKSKY